MAEIVVSRRTFLIGLIVAILAASAISTVISTQWAVEPQESFGSQGEKGDTGESGSQGLQGEQGPEGPLGVFTLENMSGWLPAPSYDSGWIQLPAWTDMKFTHGLNTTEVLVNLVRNTSDTTYHSHLGINDGISTNGRETELRWYNLTSNEIEVYARGLSEPFAFRVQMWKIAQP